MIDPAEKSAVDDHEVPARQTEAALLHQFLKESIRAPIIRTRHTPRRNVAARAAEYLDTTVGTLAEWRHHGDSPPFVKLGRTVVYRTETLDPYLKELETGGRP